MSTSLVDAFQDLKTILCVCPCCGELVRASDLHLSYKGKAPKTWLDRYDVELQRLEVRRAAFEMKVKGIRDRAVARGRLQTISRVNSCLEPGLAMCNFNPYDIKALYHPVDFVVFDGLDDKELNKIVFLDSKRRGDSVQKSLKSSIEEGSCDWRLARVTENGGVEFE